MSALPEIDTRFLVVSRARGQQLKDQAQLDGWLRDGSAAHVASLCAWSEPPSRTDLTHPFKPPPRRARRPASAPLPQQPQGS